MNTVFERKPLSGKSTAMSTSSTPNPSTASTHQEWTVQEIHNFVQEKIGKQPCWYQVKTALALYASKDVIGCAPMGAGKTLLLQLLQLPTYLQHED